MVFVDKSLEEMLKEICFSSDKPIIYDHAITQYDSYVGAKYLFDFQDRYEKLIEKNVKGEEDLRNLKYEREQYRKKPGRLSVISFLVENAGIHGYRSEEGRLEGEIIEIKYFFGSKGMVSQVSDRGKGFDHEKVIKAFESEGLEWRSHIDGCGWGMRTLMKPEYEATIKSSQIEPTGTNVTVMYKYKDSNK